MKIGLFLLIAPLIVNWNERHIKWRIITVRKTFHSIWRMLKVCHATVSSMKVPQI